MRVLTHNLGAIVTGKLRGAERALALLEQARDSKQVHERGVLRARIDLDVGLLLERKQQFDAARQRLLSARVAAEAQDVLPMIARIDAAPRPFDPRDGERLSPSRRRLIKATTTPTMNAGSRTREPSRRKRNCIRGDIATSA